MDTGQKTGAYAGSVILGEKCINTTDNSTIYTNRYEYDSSGELIAVIYNNTEYYYIRNGQNDIIASVKF